MVARMKFLYAIFGKILVNRDGPYLKYLLDKVQSSFYELLVSGVVRYEYSHILSEDEVCSVYNG